jgi:RNase P/RNase MRP subunit p29
MAATFFIKQNDTAPALEAALTDSNGRKRDMTQAATVRFHMKDENGNVLVDNEGLVINQTKGIVAYRWEEGDTATVGTHNAEFEVTYNNDGGTETFPNTGYIKVIIKEDLA